MKLTLLIAVLIPLSQILATFTSEAKDLKVCDGKYNQIEKHTNDMHGDVCRIRSAFQCPLGCFKSKPNKIPFCHKSKSNDSPCRVSKGKRKCRGKFKLLKSKESNTFYGDICRLRSAKGYRCPKGCFKTEDGKSPFCQSSKTNKAPCRTGCMNPETECKSLVQCCAAMRFAKNIERCTLKDGGSGVCCSDFLGNKADNNLLSSRSSISKEYDIRSPSLGRAIDLIQQPSFQRAIDLGLSTTRNVSNLKMTAPSTKRSSPSFFHARNQKPRDDVQQLGDLAIHSATVLSYLSKTFSNEDVNLDKEDWINDANLIDESKTNAFQMQLQSISTKDTSLHSTCDATPRCNPSSKYRNIDGTCNNEDKPNFGKSNTPLQRLLEPSYQDGIFLPRNDLPSARDVSLAMIGTSPKPSKDFTALYMSFGQFVSHDIDHVPVNNVNSSDGINCCNETMFDRNNLSKEESFLCFPIEISPNDPVFQSNRTCMNVVRSIAGPDIDCKMGPYQQINQITHWLDTSLVYGSRKSDADFLRSFENGKLRSDRNEYGSEMLPEKTGGGCKGKTKKCFLSGDLRTNEVPTLAAIHLLFLREHNRIASELHKLNPHWNDEKLYQESKKIVNGEFQHIVYNEWLPIVLGHRFMARYGLYPIDKVFSNQYENDFDPRATNAFATAAFRFGHSQIPGEIRMITKVKGKMITKSRPLRESFNDMDMLRSDKQSVDAILRGLMDDHSEKVDNTFVDDVIHFLFGAKKPNIGMDLVALNTQRGRDHGLPGYIHYREICRVGKVHSFDDLENNISKENIRKLKRLYSKVEDIDLFLGGLLEQPSKAGRAIVGDTFLCIIGDQFARLKRGDRFFYDLGNQSGSFKKNQLAEIRKASLARIICDNSDDIDKIQSLPLRVADPIRNPKQSCKQSYSIPKINLRAWKD